jgi:protocatechuate 3,4-dioxygenase, beta subunit
VTRSRRISRRHFLGAGIVLPIGLFATTAMATTGRCWATPRQTAGPFFPVAEQADEDIDLTRIAGHAQSAQGTIIRVRGQVLDEHCKPIEGALVHLWQADSFGRYRHPADRNPAQPDPHFQGWGQVVTDPEGRYSFKTIKPASYPLRFVNERADARSGLRTPHIHFRVSKRGFTDLTTQMYFAGETLNDTDHVLARVATAERPRVIIEASQGRLDEIPLFPFDIHIVTT